jgi:hypothetical protein
MDCESENHNVYEPGAEDNASGTAMAMEAARVLASEEFETSVMFIAFTGEEQGLWGSFFFVQDLFMAGRPVVGALNFDMIAWPGGQNGVALHCDTLSQTLAEFEARMADLYTTLDCSIDQEMYGSDQIAFMYFDYPATAGAEYGDFYPWYHTTGDTMGNCSFALAAEVARVAVAAAASLGAAPAQPPDFALRDAGTGGRLHASWLDSPSPDVVHYKLLWGTQSLVYTDSVVLGLQTSYDITGLANGTRYYATVIAIDAGGREGFPAAEQSAVPGEWPLAPAGFAVMPIYWGNALFWQPNQELDLAGYNLYRSTSPSAGFARLNSGLIPDTTWRDSGLLSDTMYYYYVTAVDTQTYESDTSNHAHARPITLDHGILLVDETRDGNGTPGSPSDAQQDDFYHNCLRGSNYTDWDCAARGSVPLAGDVGPYSTIVWHSDDYTQQFMRLAATGLANYLAQGGRLWFMGWKTLAGLYPPNYPYPITTYPGEFAHDWLHVALAMLSPTYDFTGASGLAGYPSVTCDSAKMYPSMHGRLSAIEALTPTDAEPVLTFNSFAGDTFQDKPVATRWLAGPGRMVHFGFPLYYMHDSEARPLAIQVLTDLGEPIGIAEKPNTELPTTPRLPTLVRRVLNLPASLVTGGSYLFTPAGRRVLSLRSGPNDISSLAPGIYFVRQSAGTPRVSKIVVTR